MSAYRLEPLWAPWVFRRVVLRRTSSGVVCLAMLVLLAARVPALLPPKAPIRLR